MQPLTSRRVYIEEATRQEGRPWYYRVFGSEPPRIHLSRFWFMFHSDRRIGFVTVVNGRSRPVYRGGSTGSVEVLGVYVVPQYRGHGLQNVLRDHAIAEMKEAGGHKKLEVLTYVNAANAPSLRNVVRSGFQPHKADVEDDSEYISFWKVY